MRGREKVERLWEVDDPRPEVSAQFSKSRFSLYLWCTMVFLLQVIRSSGQNRSKEMDKKLWNVARVLKRGRKTNIKKNTSSQHHAAQSLKKFHSWTVLKLRVCELRCPRCCGITFENEYLRDITMVTLQKRIYLEFGNIMIEVTRYFSLSLQASDSKIHNLSNKNPLFPSWSIFRKM